MILPGIPVILFFYIGGKNMNWLEKRLGKTAREQVRTVVLSGFGVFIGLRYNEFFSNLIKKLFPTTGGLLVEGIVLIIITILFVYLSVLIIKAFDGK